VKRSSGLGSFLLVCAMTITVAAQTGSGSLKVTSYPSGASVSIDGVDTGKTTPMSLSLTVGEHAVVVSVPNAGWNPDTRAVTVVPGNNDLSVTLLPALTIGPRGPAGPGGPPGPPGPAGPPGLAASRPDPPCFDNANRYENCSNGTVTDTVTGWIWLQAANCLALLHYGEANRAAASLGDGQCGLTDHLPGRLAASDKGGVGGHRGARPSRRLQSHAH
jgi:hypothetical protein